MTLVTCRAAASTPPLVFMHALSSSSAGGAGHLTRSQPFRAQSGNGSCQARTIAPAQIFTLSISIGGLALGNVIR